MGVVGRELRQMEQVCSYECILFVHVHTSVFVLL